MASGGVGASGRGGGSRGDGEAASSSSPSSSTTFSSAPPRPPPLHRLYAPGLSSLSSSASKTHMRTLSSDDGDAADAERSSSSASSTSSSSSASSSFRLSLPCRAALTGGSRGRPDLRIRLFELKAGTALEEEEERWRRGGGGGRRTPPPRRRRRRQGGGQQHQGSNNNNNNNNNNKAGSGDAASEVLDFAARAGALVYFRLACGNGNGGSGGGLAPAALGALAAVGALRAAAAPLLSSSSSPQGKRLRSSLRNSASLSRATGAALDWVDQFAPPSLLLACAGALVALAHPPGAAALRAAAAMAPVAAAYASTSRDAALGRIPEGDGALEEAWRRRHRAAALRLAPFMTDLAETPPLGWAADLADSVTAGASSSSSSCSSTFSSTGLAASLGQWGASGVGREGGGGLLWISFPLPGGGKKKRERREQEEEQEEEQLATTVAKAPPSPLLLLRSSSKPLIRRRDSTEEEEESVRGMLSIASTDDDDDDDQEQQQQRLLLSPSPSPSAVSSPKKKKMRRPWAAARSLASSSSSSSSSSSLLSSGSSSSGSSCSGSGISSAGPGTSTGDLVLFGGGDHAADGGSGGDHHSRALTPADRVALASRAAHLALVFLPFLLLAPALLVFAAALEARRKKEEREGSERRLNNNTTTTTTTTTPSTTTPAFSSTTTAASRRARDLAWSLLLSSIRASGPAFIKWGQWSATREDMFPQELCEALSSLHDAAPRHGWSATRACVESAFGGKLEDHFESFEEEPIASGSIAQVHRAVLKLRAGGSGLDGPVTGLLPVAVKVRHPNVARRIATDFRLLKPLAAAASNVRGLRGFSLQQSLAQFSATMTAQADLRVEAAHLRRMGANFARVRDSVTLPRPIPGYDCAEGCLVETFERGESVAAYMRKSAPGAASFNPQIVALGVDAYLKMLLHDNFVHTDLHPGNIMVRVRDDSDNDSLQLQHQHREHQHHHQSLESLSSSVASASRGQLQLVLLDLGLAEELTLPVRTVFISLLNAISRGDGRAGARLMLRMSARQRCEDPLAFEKDMVRLFEASADVRSPGGIDLDAVLKGALRAARAHEVSIDSGFAALVVGVCVIVGFARALDPGTNLMDAATPSLLAYNLTGRAMGRLYS